MRSTKFLFAGLILNAAAAHGNDALDWFERMRSALNSQDYEGRFVYQVDAQLDAMYVVHRVSDEGELERLVSLNGDHTQVIRGHKAVACLEPGRHRTVIEGDFAHTAESAKEKLQAYYSFTLKEGQRIAGRQAILVKVTPRDPLRYGYDLYLDHQTALPLRTVMRDPHGRQQSQMMFVELKVGRDITPIERDVSALLKADQEPITVKADVSLPQSSGWRFDSLPPGFELRNLRGGEQRHHFIISDGLASISLYVEPASSDALNGYSHVGTTRAYGTRRYGHQVTAVGDVPTETLRRIVETLEPQ